MVAVAPNSITIKSLLGVLFTVNTAGAQIDTTTVATVFDIPMESTIYVHAKRANSRSLAAHEIIVLPEDSAFSS